MTAVKLHDNDPRIAGRASGRGTAFACQISTSASGTGRASWSSTRPTSARRSPRSNSGSSSESSGPASLGRGWWLRRCDCSGNPRLLKRQLPAWPTRRSCLAPSIFARRSLSPKCSGGALFTWPRGSLFMLPLPPATLELHHADDPDAVRSTKAGARTPATLGLLRALELQHDRRSTKAGARTPATPGPRPAGAGGRHPRSTKAGARTPATLAERDRRLQAPPRLTKAGARTPATLRTFDAAHALRARSTKAGARTPATRGPALATTGGIQIAQRRPGREPWRHVRFSPANGAGRPAQRRRGANPGDTHARGRPRPRQLRSTKAGARTPATPTRRRPHRRRRRALNEGRGANPGDTSRRAARPHAVPRAQRRPGREPRRHCARSTPPMRSERAQRRPGREPRRHWRKIS